MNLNDSGQTEIWEKDFPMEESYKAADGRIITFKITAEETPAGFFIQAEETKKSRKNRLGYTFTKFSPVNPYLALGEIRDTIRERLATKYIDHTDKLPELTHDKLVGIIDYSTDDEEVVLQVDGNKITMADLQRILSGHEGFEIKIEIKEQ
ncbi:hypothetical protein HNR65_003334 [Desulfosalsimonas propionicica]|uniref:DUF7713 domain-containing protein n=1 Tax=Desulfosalsimonas propionicica TaxID=332175 RepID=A0A7W0HM46_9BACT|nr:hypothetical protein [Desulfosalsimonas propionicica]MBA2882978.1 hypothetical protein [Desulfosalsimonas propionicica]